MSNSIPCKSLSDAENFCFDFTDALQNGTFNDCSTLEEAQEIVKQMSQPNGGVRISKESEAPKLEFNDGSVAEYKNGAFTLSGTPYERKKNE